MNGAGTSGNFSPFVASAINGVRVAIPVLNIDEPDYLVCWAIGGNANP